MGGFGTERIWSWSRNGIYSNMQHKHISYVDKTLATDVVCRRVWATVVQTIVIK